MTKKDLMPYGKHKGIEMEYVPAHYLMWQWGNASIPVRKRFPQVFDYIEDNMKELKNNLCTNE